MGPGPEQNAYMWSVTYMSFIEGQKYETGYKSPGRME